MTEIKAFTVAALRGVRGARTLSVGRRGLLLGGDNGTGKSSFIQGLSLALTGKLGTATGVHVPDEYVRHQREVDAAKLVVVELSPRGRIEIRGNEAPVCDAEGQAFRDACVRSAPFLRRDELLRVVTQEDTSRRKYLEGFMDLGAVDTLELSLQERRKVLKREVDAAKVQHKESLSTWERLLRTTVSSTAAVRDAVMGRAKAAGVEVAPNADWSVVSAAILNAVQRGAVQPARRARVEDNLERASNLVPPDHPKTALARLRKAEEGAADSDVLDLLRDALGVVRARDGADPCPVCEQTIQKRALTTRLKERIAAMDELVSLRDEAEVLAEAWTTFLDELEDLERFVSDRDESDESDRAEGRDLLEHLVTNARLSLEVQERMRVIRTKLAAAKKAIPTDAETTRLAELQQALRGGPDMADLELAERDLASQSRELERYLAVERAVSKARKSEVRRILADVEGLVRRFYARIHPGDAGEEPTGAPRIVLQDHGKGAARLRGEFDGEEVDDVRSVYSDGHQDTVGLSFFLALRRSRADGEGKRDPKLMVLDDIIGSIDNGHFDRFLEVLRDDFDDHQILLASHNSLLLVQARTVLPGVVTTILAGWTLETGPELRAHTLPMDDLRRKIDTAGDPAELARALAPALEPAFRVLCRGLAVSLPYGQQDLTAGDYWPALKKKLGELERAGVIPAMSDDIDKMGDVTIYRNALGSHDNPAMLAGAALSPVKRAAEAFVRLVDKLSCVDCKGLVRLKSRWDKAPGLACQCPKGAEPKLRGELSCQSGATTRVGEA